MERHCGHRLILCLAIGFLLGMRPCLALEFGNSETLFFDNTRILAATMENAKSKIAEELSIGGYELSGGEYQSFRDWYRPQTQSISLDGITSLDDNWALLWGFSTSEKGAKYEIAPSVKLGLKYLVKINARSDVILSGYRVFGGGFDEKTCTADYGDVGGVQEVNCRLAAGILPPAETLDYLVHDHDANWGFRVDYELRF